jgi:hypothetical protein
MNYSKDAAAIDIDSKFSASIMSIDVSANLVANSNSGEIYIKINDLKQLLTNLGMASDDLGGLDIDKVSDEWIKISQDDLKDLMPQAEIDTSDYTECIENVTTTLIEKKDAQKELLNAVQDSKVLTAKRVGSDKDGIKFKLTGDINVASVFVNKLANTEIFKALENCVNEFDVDGIDQSFIDDIDALDSDPDWTEIVSQIDQLRDQLSIEVYFWVGTWDHKPTRLQVNVKASEPDIELTLDAAYKGDKTKVEIPSSSTDLTSIIQGFNDPFGDPYNGVINYDSV